MLLIALLAAVLPATFAVQCYICSWSPLDAANRTKFCTEEHFESNAVAISECEKGCEIYMHWDSNDALEHIRRNCLQDDTELTGDCMAEEPVIMYTKAKRCTCDFNLCNSASLISISWVVPLSLLFLLFTLQRLGVN